jgi:hypothetical protein
VEWIDFTTQKLYDIETMNREDISVEIFRDAGSRDVSIDAATDGVDRIRRITTGIEIVRATKLLKLTNDDQATLIKPARIRWPKFEADMNIVLTQRTLFLPPDNHSDTDIDSRGHGVRHFGVAMNASGKKIAMIDAASPDFPELVVAHEIGHMFNLKKNGQTWDSRSHCVHDTCVMYQTAGVEEVERPIERRGIRKLVESAGLIDVEYGNFIVPRAEEFCDECSHQLDKTSYFIKQSKAGKYIPPEWL